MYSLDALFKELSVYFQYVNERAAHVKIDVLPFVVNLGLSKSLISLGVG